MPESGIVCPSKEDDIQNTPLHIFSSQSFTSHLSRNEHSNVMKILYISSKQTENLNPGNQQQLGEKKKKEEEKNKEGKKKKQERQKEERQT